MERLFYEHVNIYKHVYTYDHVNTYKHVVMRCVALHYNIASLPNDDCDLKSTYINKATLTRGANVFSDSSEESLERGNESRKTSL